MKYALLAYWLVSGLVAFYLLRKSLHLGALFVGVICFAWIILPWAGLVYLFTELAGGPESIDVESRMMIVGVLVFHVVTLSLQVYLTSLVPSAPQVTKNDTTCKRSSL